MSTAEGHEWFLANRSTLPNVFLVPQTTQLKGIHTIIRDKDCHRAEFIFQSDRLIRFTVEEALCLLPTETKKVVTPTGEPYTGLRFCAKVCAVSIPRSGDTMEQGVRQVIRDVRIGKILIQRDEETHLPTLFYAKLPKDIAIRHVLLVDPMLATAGTACKAIEVLVEHGVKLESIIFVCLIAAPEGLRRLAQQYPKVRVVVSAIDDKLNTNAFILPGIGDFGDRFFGTDDYQHHTNVAPTQRKSGNN